MTSYRWRRNAKELLFNYTTNRVLLRRSEQDVIYGCTPTKDECYRRGGISNPTSTKAYLLDTQSRDRLKKEIAAVDRLLESLQTQRRIDRLCLKMLDMVYLHPQTSLLGASVRLEISDRTAKRWNNKALLFLAQEMGWMD